MAEHKVKKKNPTRDLSIWGAIKKILKRKTEHGMKMIPPGKTK